jgi:SNF2 family DNA or RNA helicase
VIDVPIELVGRQRRSYDRAERDGVVHLKELGQTITIAHVLELIQRLKQICNVCPESGESAKLDDLEDRLGVLVEEGHRALVFSQYTTDGYGVGAVARRLTRFRPLTYTGAHSLAERDRIVGQFKTRPDNKALILSVRAGGQGLNLQEASYVFHFDRWWNPAVERQAEDRSHRLGQTVPVTVYKYVCEATIEQRIDEILRRKQALFDDLVDGVSLERALTREEIFGLFDLRPPDAK